MKKEEPIYIGIDNPVEVRRALLESTKSLIHLMQGIEKLRSTRHERHELTLKLRDTIAELYGLLAHVKAEMPHIAVSHLPKKTKAKIAPVKKDLKTEPEKEEPEHKSTADLEHELDEIERKLNQLE